MDTQIFEKYESEVRSYCRSFPAVFTTAKGAVITAEDGKQFIDFFCGAGALNYGHNNDYIKQRVIDYIAGDGIIHGMDMYTNAKRDFLGFFEQEVLQPRGLDYKVMFTGPTGTNAVEAALKLARKVKGRTNVLALMGAFNGMSLGSLALTCDKSSRKGAGLPLHDVVHVPAPYMFPELDTVDYIEKLLTDDHSGVDHPAAMVIETVQAEGGIYVFDPEFLRRIRALCDKYDMLLIVDDIQVGCGRTGTFLSFERAGIVPDMVTLSKSIGAYGFPLALLLFKPELDIWTPGEHNGTFRGNQVAFVAAKAGLEIMLRDKLEAQVQAKQKVIEKFINEEILPIDPRLEARGIGMIWGVDLGSIPGDKTKEVCDACFRRGLIMERAGRKNCVAKIMPPLVIDEATLLKGLGILRDSIKEVL